MSYDEGLAERLRNYFESRNDVEEKEMFGGLCFMVSNHMCCGIVKDILMLRVGPDNYESCLTKNHASEMNFTGKAMKGMVYIAPEGFDSDMELAEWVGICTEFVESLLPKKPK
ncbi:MAG: TfoX/Sxy family protein [Gammaproteobacteria bacterium]|nr:TfoX/Sxy family protein [Gammaproteobacteria bacterium]MCF6258585.1 TfoX/Sxy family protein [Gammaproteobacteria bacterium]